MFNINTKEYWDARFLKNWKKVGQKQTTEYAKANVQNLPVNSDFKGTILDFGCAMGDAIPVYLKSFPQAKIIGYDISETAIKSCQKRYGQIADFFSGNIIELPSVNIIIASHVMEHITNDKSLVRELLKKCDDLFVFVPYKERPLFIEHVNYYDDNYYDDLPVINKNDFTVSYKSKIDVLTLLKNFLKLRFGLVNYFSKDIIMFHLRGNPNNTSIRENNWL